MDYRILLFILNRRRFYGGLMAVILSLVFVGGLQGTVAQPSLSERHSLRGAELVEAGKFDAARRALELAMVADPKNARAIVWLGQAHAGLGNLEISEKYFNTAMSISPDDPQILLIVGKSDVAKGALDAAREKLRRLTILCGETCPQTLALTQAMRESGGAPARGSN